MIGLGQRAGQFADPDNLGAGIATWDQTSGVPSEDPFVTGPEVGGYDLAPASGTGLTRIAAGGAKTAPERAGNDNWSDIMNFAQSPLPYLLIISLLLLGVASVSVSARVGK